jgi:phenylacetate-coenzyme A ligase PaaK-like adenylate-forming protein
MGGMPMGTGSWLARFAFAARARALASSSEGNERLAPDALRDLQRARLTAIVRHAAERSPLYRDLYRGLDLSGVIEPAALPTVQKRDLMERFDDWVTDPRLRLADLDRHLESIRGDDLYLGEYRAMATGGTTGRRGIFVYSRAEWLVSLSGFIRMNAHIGIKPRLPRVRIAAVTAASPVHMSARFGMTIDVGIHRPRRFDARRPAADLAPELASFRPDVLGGYPSVLALLADEQLAGRVDIHPRVVFTSSEVSTPEMRRRMADAWGVRPFDMYASTEGGITAVDCEHRRGRHLLEDLVWIENVDEGGEPVPDGQPGARLLLTNLYNRTQPIIRYELSDIATIESGPCPCGRTSRRIVAIDGRSDDIIVLPGRNGREVSVHPLAVRSPFASLAEVRQYQVVHDDDGLHVRAVLGDGVAAEQAVARVQQALAAKLAELGVELPPIEVEIVTALVRDQGHAGKLKLVESRRGRARAIVPCGAEPVIAAAGEAR